MSKTYYILLLLCASAGTSYAESNNLEHEYAVLINKGECSDTLVLHQGSAWVLVKADFHIDSAKCWSERYRNDEFSWDTGIEKVSFPQHQTMLLYLEKVDQSFAGLWHCIFLGLSRNVSQPVSCTIKFEVREGTAQSANIPTLERTRSSKYKGIWIWIGIIVGLTLTFIIIVAVVILCYKRKVARCNEENPDDVLTSVRPSLPVPTESDEVEHKPISDTTYYPPENLYEYEGVYNHGAGLLRKAPIPLPQVPHETDVMTIKRRL